MISSGIFLFREYHFSTLKYVFFKHLQKNTVKLGYNELGYNEHPVITNKMNSFGWFQLI